jgi:hypothetical protein
MPSQNSVVTVSRRRAASDSKADDKDKESAAYLKRREQVRRAQRYVFVTFEVLLGMDRLTIKL